MSVLVWQHDLGTSGSWFFFFFNTSLSRKSLNKDTGNISKLFIQLFSLVLRRLTPQVAVLVFLMSLLLQSVFLLFLEIKI